MEDLTTWVPSRRATTAEPFASLRGISLSPGKVKEQYLQRTVPSESVPPIKVKSWLDVGQIELTRSTSRRRARY